MISACMLNWIFVGLFLSCMYVVFYSVIVHLSQFSIFNNKLSSDCSLVLYSTLLQYTWFTLPCTVCMSCYNYLWYDYYNYMHISVFDSGLGRMFSLVYTM